MKCLGLLSLFFFFHSESYSVNKFGFINFTCPNDNLLTTAENVCNFEFKRKAVKIFRGANKTDILNHLKWKENSQNYVRKFYTKEGTFVEPILIPDLQKKKETPEILWNETINLEVMRQWCSISDSELGLIIPNYNILDHFGFNGISESDLQEVLNIKSIHSNINRLLIFNASWKLLVVIRTASETHLKEEIDYCITDINMLLLMFRDELEDSGVVVTGLIVYLGENLHLERNCSNCQHFIVTSEVFESAESMDIFWTKYKEEEIFQKIKIALPNGDKEKEFMAVSSKVLPYLASYQYHICGKQVLPTLEEEPTRNIEQAELLLDRYQMEIAHSMENRIILKGNYGNGKTIICLKKIKLLSKKLRDKETIYYINFQGESELDGVVSKKIKKYHRNINVLKGDTTLSNIIESKVLPREEDAGTKMVHLFVDEFNTESLTKEEVSTVVKLFSKRRLLKQSKILLAVQPIEMKRIDFHCVNGEESEYCENRNMLCELEKIMTVKHLQYVMRTTVEINSLIEITQEYLNEKSNQYTRNLESSECMLEDEVTQNADLDIHENFDPNGKVISQKNELLTRDSKNQIISFEHEFNISKNPQIDFTQKVSSSNSNSNFKPFQFEKTVDFDELHKLTSTENTGNGENFQRRETTYRYHCQSSIGHNISGRLPTLINLTHFDQNEAFLLFASLFEFIGSKTKRTAIIHFDYDNSCWLVRLFKLSTIIPSLTILDDVEDFFSNKNEKLVLVKNYKYVRGIEFSDVILLLDANEYHLKQFIPEAMARCQSNLSIVIKPAENVTGKEDTVMNLMEHWVNVNREQEKEKLIKTLLLNFCKCSSAIMCKKEAVKQRREEDTGYNYKIHKHSQSYKKISEKFNREMSRENKRTIISDTSSNLLGKKEALRL